MKYKITMNYTNININNNHNTTGRGLLLEQLQREIFNLLCYFQKG